MMDKFRAAAYMTKYLTKDHPPELLRMVSGPVVSVSRRLTRQSGVTMALLRKARRLWSARAGRCDYPDWDEETTYRVARILDGTSAPARAP